MILLALPLVASLVAGPCDLVDKAKITALLGQPAPAGVPAGPEKDEDTGAMMTHCTYQLGNQMVIVSNAAFESAAAARKATTQELVKERMDVEAKVTQESGIGDAGFWAVSERGAMYVVLKGARVVAVALGGQLPKATATYHDALKEVTVTASSR